MPIPTVKKDQERLKNMLTEISNCMTRIEGERDCIKEIVEDAGSSFELDKKYIRRVAKALHQASFDKLKVETEEFETLYETLFPEDA